MKFVDEISRSIREMNEDSLAKLDKDINDLKYESAVEDLLNNIKFNLKHISLNIPFLDENPTDRYFNLKVCDVSTKDLFKLNSRPGKPYGMAHAKHNTFSSYLLKRLEEEGFKPKIYWLRTYGWFFWPVKYAWVAIYYKDLLDRKQYGINNDSNRVNPITIDQSVMSGVMLKLH